MRNFLKILSLLLLQSYVPLARSYALVLMYHSVENSDWKYGVSPEDFERQIAYLKKQYDVVHLDEVVSYAKGEKKISRPTIAVTIDDGYEDTYAAAFPVLKKYNVPATVFLTTNLSVNKKFGNLPRPTAEQIREMHDSGLVRFEAHGRDHKNLREMDTESEAFVDEVLGSRDDIEQMTGRCARYIAYASGNRNERIQEKVESFGFEAGFGITEGIVRPEDNLFALRRVQIDRTMPFILFRLRTTHAIDTYYKIINNLKLLRRCI